jgi:hypothetical protein
VSSTGRPAASRRRCLRYRRPVPGIFLRRDKGELVHLRSELYESEDQLQGLLEANPELLLGETAGSDRPSKYLLVRREAGVPEADRGSDRWFLDHLFLDAEGVPTLVEVKRSSDTRIRREVVGQMLDYAANILAHWPPERMRDEFEARCNHAGVEPAEKVREISDADYEDYRTRVKTNLAAKRLRLVFVADEIPASLQTIVEFLNEQMRAAEVLAVEVKQHKGDGVTVLTTQIIGRTSTAQHAKAVTEKREWSSESGLDEMRRSSSSAETVAVAEGLLSWANDRNLPVAWGSGAKIGYAKVVVAGPHDSTAGPFGLSTDSKLDLYPHEMRRLPPFNRDDLRLEFVRRIGAAAGMPVEDTIIDQSFKSFPLSDFSQPENYKAVVAALDWFVEQTGAAHASA